MQKRAKASRLRSAVRRFGAGSVAARLGVSTSTVRRWLKRPDLVADETIGRLETLEGEIGITPKLIRETLKLESSALAAIFGVSLSTARKWKRNKKIPTNRQSILADVAPEATPKKLTTVKRAFGAQALYTEGFEFTTVVNAIVTAKLIRMLANWAAKIVVPRPWPKGPGPKYQFIFRGNILLGFDETLLGVGSSKEIQQPTKEPNGFSVHTMAVPTENWWERDRAFREFIADLEAVEDQSFHLEGATLWVRWDKITIGKDMRPKKTKQKPRKGNPKKPARKSSLFGKTRVTKALLKQLSKNKKGLK